MGLQSLKQLVITRCIWNTHNFTTRIYQKIQCIEKKQNSTFFEKIESTEEEELKLGSQQQACKQLVILPNYSHAGVIEQISRKSQNNCIVTGVLFRTAEGVNLTFHCNENTINSPKIQKCYSNLNYCRQIYLLKLFHFLITNFCAIYNRF